MTKWVLFFNSFLSYLLLTAIFVITAGIAIYIGIRLRKQKEAQRAAETSTEEKTKAGTTNEI